MATKTKRKTKPKGIDEERVLIPGPSLLWMEASVAAKREGITRSEWVRRAMRARLSVELTTAPR